MDAYICRTCAVQYAPSDVPPERCIICEDERQYVNWAGQQWTTLAELKAQGYKIVLREQEPGLTGIGIEPHLGIGQRALLVQTPQGNVLWDCIGYIDDEAVARFDVLDAACVHRTGDLAIGELAVWVGVAAAHRDAAFAACRWIIDEVKARVPVWKHERYADAPASWLHPDA